MPPPTEVLDLSFPALKGSSGAPIIVEHDGMVTGMIVANIERHLLPAQVERIETVDGIVEEALLPPDWEGDQFDPSPGGPLQGLMHPCSSSVVAQRGSFGPPKPGAPDPQIGADFHGGADDRDLCREVQSVCASHPRPRDGDVSRGLGLATSGLERATASHPLGSVRKFLQTI